jgi:hypothetical protein
LPWFPKAKPPSRKPCGKHKTAAVQSPPIYFRWRPNLPDAEDDPVSELAIAGGVEHLVTHNPHDFGRGELKFNSPRVVTLAQHLKIVK